jgi:hypothetical protein
MDVQIRQVRGSQRDEVAQSAQVGLEFNTATLTADIECDLGMDAGSQLARELNVVFGGLGGPGRGGKLAEDSGADNIPALKAASEAALVTTWTNPAGRAGGNLRFSPHNQQVVGNKIYLSSYHGGVYVLDATAAFQGQDVRPSEVGFYVPSSTPNRPMYQATVQPVLPFISTFFGNRPSFWDAIFYKGSVLAADWHGGFYSFQSCRRTSRRTSIPCP